jgi:Ca2+-binding EF-hand superfamily protein
MTTPTGQKRSAALKAALSLDIVLKNPIFSSEHVEELFNMFYLYADPRSSKADIRDVLVTARALGLDKKYELVFRAIEEVSEVHGGDRITFESFIKDLTRIIVVI